jgi:hypothetical protein
MVQILSRQGRHARECAHPIGRLSRIQHTSQEGDPMRRRTLAAVVISLCTAGAAAPTIATAAAEPPTARVTDITDGTSNTIMVAEAATSPALSLDFTKIEYTTLPR